MDSPVPISADVAVIRHVMALLGEVPTPVWGPDELHTGEMWNSNSVISWVLDQAGLLDRAGMPPRAGHAPGWDAGVIVAHREQPRRRKVRSISGACRRAARKEGQPMDAPRGPLSSRGSVAPRRPRWS